MMLDRRNIIHIVNVVLYNRRPTSIHYNIRKDVYTKYDSICLDTDDGRIIKLIHGDNQGMSGYLPFEFNEAIEEIESSLSKYQDSTIEVRFDSYI